MNKKGWIALDIDGTITNDLHTVPKDVVAYLRHLQTEGWGIAIATRRHLGFSEELLSAFDFPYHFLPQNGSGALSMPTRQVLFKHFLPGKMISELNAACEGSGTHFLIYMGFDQEDLCYFCPDRFSQEDVLAIEYLRKRQGGKWQALKSFSDEPIAHFALAKCFGSFEQMQAIAQKLPAEKFQIACIRNPFRKEKALLLINDAQASKGLGMQELFRQFGKGERVIAAGDDENDESLFLAADIKIAMPHAPARLLELADLIARPTEEQGIIEALKKAVRYDRRI